MKFRHTLFIFLLLLVACTPTPHDVKMAQEPMDMYPDYQDITIPCNMAPLNFMLRGDYEAISVEINGSDGTLKHQLSCRGNKVLFPEDTWRDIMLTHLGSDAQVTITALRDGQWWQFPAFSWSVSTDSVDAYLTYRLIEPGYEVWDKVDIEERCTESFATRRLAIGSELGNRCMNCHTHGGERGQYSFFHLRGERGGTIVNRNGQLHKVTLRKEGMPSGAVYGDWHPTGRYGVFSTNVIIPAFHSLKSRRLEVYDTTSDLCVADFDRDSLLLPPLASGTSNVLETFPAFSADGQWIYYCSAPNPCGDTLPSAANLLPFVDSLQYSLCRMSFDAETGSFGQQIDTVYNARLQGGSANFPKCSPDGRYLAFCLSSRGTFPIWHRETRIVVRNIQAETHQTSQTLLTPQTPQPSQTTDSPESATSIHATYHSWSHNSRWLAFASKEYDGQYGRIYFVHVGEGAEGEVVLSKPMVLPQADPEMDDWNLRSYNIPDLGTEPMAFGQNEVKMLLENTNAAPFK